MKRNYKSKSIKSILENFVEQENLVDGIFNIKIKEAWEKAVEKKIFDYTKEIYVKGDVFSHLTSDAYSNYFLPKILEKINF